MDKKKQNDQDDQNGRRLFHVFFFLFVIVDDTKRITTVGVVDKRRQQQATRQKRRGADCVKDCALFNGSNWKLKSRLSSWFVWPSVSTTCRSQPQRQAKKENGSKQPITERSPRVFHRSVHPSVRPSRDGKRSHHDPKRTNEPTTSNDNERRRMTTISVALFTDKANRPRAA